MNNIRSNIFSEETRIEDGYADIKQQLESVMRDGAYIIIRDMVKIVLNKEITRITYYISYEESIESGSYVIILHLEDTEGEIVGKHYSVYNGDTKIAMVLDFVMYDTFAKINDVKIFKKILQYPSRRMHTILLQTISCMCEENKEIIISHPKFNDIKNAINISDWDDAISTLIKVVETI